MQINTHVFQVAATIYESLLSHKDNKIPHDPSYAHEAKRLAEMIYKASKNDPIYSMAAARALCGFKKNPTSGHCTLDELVNLSLLGASLLVEAFSNRAPLTVAQHSFAVPVNNHPPPSMPDPIPQTISPMGLPVSAPPFVVPPPVTSVDVPDFTTEGSQR